MTNGGIPVVLGMPPYNREGEAPVEPKDRRSGDPCHPDLSYALFTYDADGNMTRRVEDGWTTTMGYDCLGEMLWCKIKDPSGTLVTSTSASYDAFGRQWGAVTEGVSWTRFVYDGSERLAECRYSSGAWNFDYCFTNGPAGMLHQEDRRVATPHRFFHEDAVGSVWNITDASGAITDWRNYDAFGNFDDGAGMSGVRARFGGTNGYRADDNGLLLLGHRYYDSKYGRFITQDPIGLAGGDLNLYAYCWNNPLTGIDPSGLTLFLGPGISEEEKTSIKSAVQILRKYISENRCLANDPDVNDPTLQEKMESYLAHAEWDPPSPNQIGESSPTTSAQWDMEIRVGGRKGEAGRKGYTAGGQTIPWISVMQTAFTKGNGPSVAYTILHELLHKCGLDEKDAIRAGNEVLGDQRGKKNHWWLWYWQHPQTRPDPEESKEGEKK